MYLPGDEAYQRRVTVTCYAALSGNVLAGMATCVSPRALVIASALFRAQVFNVRRKPERSFHSSVPRRDVYKDANLDVRIILTPHRAH